MDIPNEAKCAMTLSGQRIQFVLVTRCDWSAPQHIRDTYQCQVCDVIAHLAPLGISIKLLHDITRQAWSLFLTVCFTKEVNVIDAKIFEVAQSRPTGCRTPAERCQVGQEAGA